MRTVLTVIVFALAPVAAVAQPIAPPVPPPLAPQSPPPAPLSPAPPAPPPPAAAEQPFLKPGTEVSQPLTAVGPVPVELPTLTPRVEEPKLEPAPKLETNPIEAPPARGPLGPQWGVYELLYWWPMRQPVPALAVGTRSGFPPVVGDPATSLLIGGNSVGSQPHAGGRFTTGSSLNNAETFGYEVTYMFLGTRTYRETVSDLPGSRVRGFGVPYVNSVTGASEFLTLALPGISSSAMSVSTSTRVQGWEVNTVANLVDGKNFKLNGLAGWRYFQLHEGLRIEQTQLRFVDLPGTWRTADQFDAHNRFHGGQLGLHADARSGIVFCELTAKVAFGQNYEVVKTEGMNVIQTPVFGGVATRAFGGSGIYVQPSNFGRTAGGVFAVVPEGTVKLGFRLGDSARLYLGYSFIYLSDAVRPGDQIDRTLNPANIPLLNGIGPVFAADRPTRTVNRSDAWVQGLTIGLETRY
ncbi:BBP7 family outer membrane beta-barrel protein [Gemmata sp. JC717]|uniref:BBP7 family outer membrane beta-barrel protein n=1 Tax=Gemmata algarum TaxID=2975278 RepID=UPI0021BBA615|nr:BBP7 family outer membrane beta-barrel protein [Gemmata algarum]MDY3554045.1 BBP7 family outer membrane beta-barrel protein [Gemmata algarum]